MSSKQKRGRPPLVPGGMRRICVQLDPPTIDRAGRIGAGNVSAGIRRAVARYRLAPSLTVKPAK